MSARSKRRAQLVDPERSIPNKRSSLTNPLDSRYDAKRSDTKVTRPGFWNETSTGKSPGISSALGLSAIQNEILPDLHYADRLAVLIDSLAGFRVSCGSKGCNGQEGEQLRCKSRQGVLEGGHVVDVVPIRCQRMQRKARTMRCVFMLQFTRHKSRASSLLDWLRRCVAGPRGAQPAC